ncbi:MAG: hypothetical protein RLZZ324_1011 [Candidatus Parcubacteria bacterium]|jgi:hypothetical protein
MGKRLIACISVAGATFVVAVGSLGFWWGSHQGGPAPLVRVVTEREAGIQPDAARANEIEQRLNAVSSNLESVTKQLDACNSLDAVSASYFKAIRTVPQAKIAYHDAALGLSYAYPAAWGDVQSVGEGWLAYSDFSGIKSGFALASVNPTVEPPGMDGNWTTESAAITGEASVASYCKGKKECVTYRNTHGILIASVGGRVPGMGDFESLVPAARYFLFHPTRKRGIVISFVRTAFHESDPGLEDDVKRFVDTIAFTR